MLKIHIDAIELFDENTSEFISIKGQTIAMEHSLVSISKWEEKWGVPFIGKGQKTNEQWLDYFKCMTITQNVPDEVYYALTSENITQIQKYIEDPHTATFFKDDKRGGTKTITSEEIYSWMIALNVPVEFQKWHVNRLLTLIRLININNDPKKNKKMSRSDLMSRNDLNAQRRAQLHSKG